MMSRFRRAALSHFFLVFSLTLSMAVSLLPAPAEAGLALPSTADYGDAPDSTNPGGAAMPVYPGVAGHFHTIFTPGAASSAGQGPKHNNATVQYYLGTSISAEWLAESGQDADGVNNLDLAAPQADLDGHDDGLRIPSRLPHCGRHTFQIAVTARDVGQTFPFRASVNLWMDFDRGGRWGGAYTCPDGTFVPEWALQNQIVAISAPGTQIITLPAVYVWNEKASEDMWVRISIADAAAPSEDGSGPANGYLYGETEDHKFEGVGDAPPVATLPPYQVGELTAEIPPPPLHLPLVAAPTVPWSPDEIVVPNGELKEVAFAHVGGSYQGPLPPYAVTIGGTGWAGKLTSWNLGNPLGAPTPIQTGPMMLGYNHQVHVLSPQITPNLAHEMFVTGRLRDDALWLTTWKLSPAGNLIQLHTRGYGPNAGVIPQHYAMAHSEIEISGDTRRFQLVTPIVHNDTTLRLVTWEVNGITGVINGRGDSGDVASNLHVDSDLSAVWLAGEGFVPDHYVVSMVHENRQLMHSHWYVDNAGVPDLRGLDVSGRNISDDGGIQVPATSVATAPLGDTGFHSAVNGVGTSTAVQLRMHTWENLPTTCNAEQGCELRSSNISDNSLDLNQAGLGVMVQLPVITTDRAALYDPLYEDWLYTKNEGTQQQIASVRKVMVAMVALDEVNAGNVSLDDEVTISEAAANVNNTGASKAGLVEDEVMTLRDLLWAMMMVSGGDATWAISEHVGGDLDGMVDMMNDKAAELGLSDTLYCRNPASQGFSSVGYSTATDQALLWASVYDDLQFLDFAGRAEADVCGTLPGGEELCHPAIPPMTKDMDNYPNLDGHKTGGGGGLCTTGNATIDAEPACVSGGCLSVQSTRLQRSLVLSELQPAGMTGNRWPDAETLFNYGFRTVFTPDFVQTSGGQAGQAIDFGLDYVTDSHSATAQINGGNEIVVCNWNTWIPASQLNKGGCARLPITGLVAGTDAPPPTRLALVRISTLEAEGDYILGRLEGSSLVLRLWRVGEKDF